jgi:hypothetical protein
MKKFFSSFAVCVLFTALIPAQSARAAGVDDLVKCPDFSAVYYVGDDGNRYVFPNENIYFSWFPDFSEVKTISCDDLASFPIGDRLVYQPGTSLVKIPSDPSVYAVESDGVLREIPDEDTAKALFGDDWAERVDDVSEAFWPSFTVGEPLEDGEVPEGTVLDDGEGSLYRVNADGSATEIDVVLDTDEEDVLESHAIPLDDIERRLGVAMALVSVDADAAIAVLEQLLAELKPIAHDAEHQKTVADVSEMSDDHSAQENAKHAIEKANEEIEKAQEDIVRDAADGEDVTGRETMLLLAESALDTAQASYDAGEYLAAITQAKNARRSAQIARGKAVDHIHEDDDGEGDEDQSDEDVTDDGSDDHNEDAEDTADGEADGDDDVDDRSDDSTDDNADDRGNDSTDDNADDSGHDSSDDSHSGSSNDDGGDDEDTL